MLVYSLTYDNMYNICTPLCRTLHSLRFRPRYQTTCYHHRNNLLLFTTLYSALSQSLSSEEDASTPIWYVYNCRTSFPSVSGSSSRIRLLRTSHFSFLSKLPYAHLSSRLIPPVSASMEPLDRIEPSEHHQFIRSVTRRASTPSESSPSGGSSSTSMSGSRWLTRPAGRTPWRRSPGNVAKQFSDVSMTKPRSGCGGASPPVSAS
mmetsp:Transcript_15341/g.33130  ORF Transcript_15341/g.33130 Transcript_15341/m.33130 type:complete len:205 (-) Transcript_15341:529-1143(-)